MRPVRQRTGRAHARRPRRLTNPEPDRHITREPGFAVYDTFGLGRHAGWIRVGGTSASAPLIAGMIGLAGNASDFGSAQDIYQHSAGLADAVGGSNGYCGGDYLCRGKVGYDAPTG